MRYVIHDKATGQILRQGVVPDGSDWHTLQLRNANEAVLLPAKGVPVDDIKHAVDIATGAIVAKPPPAAATVAASALATLRRKRDHLLAASDWTQLPDVPATTGAAWSTYRKRLRDLPADTIDPANPAWPQAPRKD